MRALRLACALAFAFAIVHVSALGAAASVRVIAQLTLPTAAPSSLASGIQQQGSYLTAPIELDGAKLLVIATAVNASATQTPIAARIVQIQTALAELVAEDGTGPGATPVFDPKTLRVHARRVGDALVIEAVDAKHPDPLPIVTVTAVDAHANGIDVSALAGEWQVTLQSAIVRALILRQPAVERRSLQSVIVVVALLAVSSLVVIVLLRDQWRRMALLESEITARNAAAQAHNVSPPEETGASRQRRRFLALRLRTLKPAQRLNLLAAFSETMLWALAIAWVIAVTWSLSLFAQTTPIAQTIAQRALGVGATIVFTALVSRAFDAIIGRTSGAWRLRRFTNSDDRARTLLRVPTIAGALVGAKNVVLVFVAVLSVLGQIGVPIGSVVTIGGVTAIALSLAAQNFVRDFLNGFLVLLEDQYVVGDYVTINSFSGIVERLTLRMVQIRDAAGDLVTVPHSAVISVVNGSRNWSRVDFRIPIDPSADIPQAIEIVRAQITALAAADDWMHDLGEPIEWIGIDALSKDWVIVRASVRTAPLRQFELRRQINERVLAALLTAGIPLGAPLPA